MPAHLTSLWLINWSVFASAAASKASMLQVPYGERWSNEADMPGRLAGLATTTLRALDTTAAAPVGLLAPAFAQVLHIA